MNLPSRYIHLDQARARHGDRVDRFGRFFTLGDPLGDATVEALSALPRDAREALIDRCLAAGTGGVGDGAVPDAPPALVRLFEQLDHVPLWVDFERARRGGELFLRAGPLGGLVLGCYSLVGGYCSPAGNKPLAFSGRLTEDAPRRLAETSHFVRVVSEPDGLRRHAEGFRTTVRVRLVHASVRRMLQRSPRWDAAAWGLPINQADMIGTVLLFSHLALDGLQKLGLRLSLDEREDVLHLWRYVGWLLGVDPDLLCATEAEAVTVWDLLSSTQGLPDEDSRILARALMESAQNSAPTPEAREQARRRAPFGYAVSRYLLGDRYADALGYPRTRWRFAIPALRAVAGRTHALFRVLPRGGALSLEAGLKYWEFVVRAGLGDSLATYPLPPSG